MLGTGSIYHSSPSLCGCLVSRELLDRRRLACDNLRPLPSGEERTWFGDIGGPQERSPGQRRRGFTSWPGTARPPPQKD